MIIYRLAKIADTNRKKVSKTRCDIQADHGFRKRFNTILKLKNNVNSNIAEKLLNHKNGLDAVYLKPTKEQCFAEFLKAVPDLTISDEERPELKIQELEGEKNKIIRFEKEIKENEKIRKDVAKILRHLNLEEN